MLTPRGSFWMHLLAFGAFAAIALMLSVEAFAQPTWGRPKTNKPDGANAQPDDNNPAGEETGLVAAPGRWTDTDPEQKQPAPDGEPGVWYAARTMGGKGQRYLWVLPESFEKGKGYDVVVLLHPKGQSVRFGLSTHSTIDAENGFRFRPEDILICMDGLSVVGRTPDDRGFVPSEESILAFRESMLEFSRQFPVRRFYLYGVGTGADFALAFAARFPALAEGLLLYRPTGLSGELVSKGARPQVPVVILHGSRDSTQNIGVTIALHRMMAESGCATVRFRAIPAFNHYPNPVRVSECVDWAAAMNATDPAEVLARARAILEFKGQDELGYVGPVWFTGAYEALSRITGKGAGGGGAANTATSSAKPAGGNLGAASGAGEAGQGSSGASSGEGALGPWKKLEGVTDEVLAGATALQNAIEAHAALHINGIREAIGGEKASAEDVVPDGTPTAALLWHLRQDFRGVDNVETFVSALGYDTLLDTHVAVGADLVDAYEQERSPDARTALAAQYVPHCFLAPTLPMLMGEMASQAEKNGELSEELLEFVELLNNVEKTWGEGGRAYAKLWRQWSLPDAFNAEDAEQDEDSEGDGSMNEMSE